MDLPRNFLRYENLELAFARVVRGGNKSYKRYFAHLFPSYNLALQNNLTDLMGDLRRGLYTPARATVIYQPKQSGVLRPLALLTLRDQIVYQAILNHVAACFETEQARFALKRSFGAILAGRSSLFFYRSWKRCYQTYNNAITQAFNSGYDHVADFDLVSFYELIDHHLLAERLAERVKSKPLINLLVTCLRSWTSDGAATGVGHGVPQGPEPSAFLAECFLMPIDAKTYRNTRYFRYVDDIRLMAKDEIPIRRALISLDLRSKELGLVPQAQKIEYRQVRTLDELLKTIPSALAGAGANTFGLTIKVIRLNEREILKAFSKSLRRKGRELLISDVTKFKFALHRLRPRRRILRQIQPLLVSRPDLSYYLSHYIRRFKGDPEAADIVLAALQRDPAYDAAAADYIDALDVCEPNTNVTKYRQMVTTANQRSVEKSITIRAATISFRACRLSAKAALKLIAAEADPLVRGLLIHRVFGDHHQAHFNKSLCHELLASETESKDPDLARYAASLLLEAWPWFVSASWFPSSKSNHSVGLLMQALGLRKRTPRKKGVLDLFFRDRFGIAIDMPWRRALRKDFRETERRCLRLQELLIGDPTARITLLDTFNELLIQSFSEQHPVLRSAYTASFSSPNQIPDLGSWLRNRHLVACIPKAARWFLSVHEARIAGELAHAKAKKTGLHTRPISFRRADQLLQGAASAWFELMDEWTRSLASKPLKP